MTKRKGAFLLGLIWLTILVGVAAFLFWPDPDPITPENYELVREAKTIEEVKAILGREPSLELWERDRCDYLWISEAWMIFVAARDGRVVGSHCRPHNAAPGLWERARRRLGL